MRLFQGLINKIDNEDQINQVVVKIPSEIKPILMISLPILINRKNTISTLL
jgi:hypothetical protein